MTAKIHFQLFLMLIGLCGLISCSTFSEADNNSPKSNKMTGPSATDNALRMGIKVDMKETDTGIAHRIGQQIEKNLGKFEVCLKHLKTEVVSLKARWTLSKDGVFENVHVISMNVDSNAFKTCFVKEINKLQLNSEKKLFQGELQFATFWGTENDWKEPKRPLQKGQ